VAVQIAEGVTGAGFLGWKPVQVTVMLAAPNGDFKDFWVCQS